MMAPRRSAAAALLAAAPKAPATVAAALRAAAPLAPATAAAALLAAVPLAPATAAAASSTAPRADSPQQQNLYGPSPSFAAHQLSGQFYKAYGLNLSSLELDRGAQLGSLALVKATPTQAQARAGLTVDHRSPWRLVLLAFALAAVTLLASLATLASGLTTTAARAAVPDGFFGITTQDVYTGTNDYAARQLATQHKMGFSIARQPFLWNEIEYGRGSYDFSATDRFVLNTAKAGIRVMPLLFGEPGWASSRPAKQKNSRNVYPPKDDATFAEFAAAIATRYGPNGTLWQQNPQVTPVPITSYQIWNEPNFPLYWAGKPSGAAYAKLVIAASKAIRAVQPQAYIVSAGIPDSTIGQAPKTFIRAMLKAGAGSWLNAIGVHPYAIDVTSVMKITRAARKTINAVGGSKLGIWVTEIGWAAGGPKTPARTVSYAKQGPIIASAFKALAAARASLKLQGVIYYCWRDATVYKGGKDFWGLHTGLLKLSGAAKPALKVVAAAMKSIK